MNGRRGFFGKLLGGAAVAVVAPKLLDVTPERPVCTINKLPWPDGWSGEYVAEQYTAAFNRTLKRFDQDYPGALDAHFSRESARSLDAA